MNFFQRTLQDLPNAKKVDHLWLDECPMCGETSGSLLLITQMPLGGVQLTCTNGCDEIDIFAAIGISRSKRTRMWLSWAERIVAESHKTNMRLIRELERQSNEDDATGQEEDGAK